MSSSEEKEHEEATSCEHRAHRDQLLPTEETSGQLEVIGGWNV